MTIGKGVSIGCEGGKQESKYQGFWPEHWENRIPFIEKRNMGERVGLERKTRLHLGQIRFEAVGCVSLQFKREI